MSRKRNQPKAFILDYIPPMQSLVNEGSDMNLTPPVVGFLKQRRGLGARRPIKWMDSTRDSWPFSRAPRKTDH